jgi:hypothetical protein
VNGPITASAIFIKPEGEEGREFVIRDNDLEIKWLLERMDRLEKALYDYINSQSTKSGGNK